MTKQPLNELLNCPFCGGEAMIEEPTTLNVEFGLFTHEKQYTVMCDKCSCNCCKWSTKEDAIKWWNTRVSPSNAVEEKENNMSAESQWAKDKRNLSPELEHPALDSEGDVLNKFRELNYLTEIIFNSPYVKNHGNAQAIASLVIKEGYRKASPKLDSEGEVADYHYQRGFSNGFKEGQNKILETITKKEQLKTEGIIEASPNREKVKVPLNKGEAIGAILGSLTTDEYRALQNKQNIVCDMMRIIKFAQAICAKFSMPDVEVPSVESIEQLLYDTEYPEHKGEKPNQRNEDFTLSAIAILDLLQKGRKC